MARSSALLHGIPYSAAEKAEIVRLRDQGIAWPEIGARLGRAHQAARRAIGRDNDPECHRARPVVVDPRAKDRLCLTCRGVFPSAHAGNRMCDPCREQAAEFSPFEIGVYSQCIPGMACP